jgi:hypothetical protein
MFSYANFLTNVKIEGSTIYNVLSTTFTGHFVINDDKNFCNVEDIVQVVEYLQKNQTILPNLHFYVKSDNVLLTLQIISNISYLCQSKHITIFVPKSTNINTYMMFCDNVFSKKAIYSDNIVNSLTNELIYFRGLPKLYMHLLYFENSGFVDNITHSEKDKARLTNFVNIEQSPNFISFRKEKEISDPATNLLSLHSSLKFYSNFIL